MRPAATNPQAGWSGARSVRSRVNESSSSRLGDCSWLKLRGLPTFRQMENTPTGDDAFHGRSGPLSVRQRSDEELTPSLLGFVEASVAHGFKRVHDFNGAEQNGADGYPVDVVDGVRQNTGLVYLTAAVRARPNLTVLGGVNVDRVRLEGKRAVGVVAAGGTIYRAGEVILAGGTYGSPAILLRSGVGHRRRPPETRDRCRVRPARRSAPARPGVLQQRLCPRPGLPADDPGGRVGRSVAISNSRGPASLDSVASQPAARYNRSIIRLREST
jgi:hypothetical protein